MRLFKENHWYFRHGINPMTGRAGEVTIETYWIGHVPPERITNEGQRVISFIAGTYSTKFYAIKSA